MVKVFTGRALCACIKATTVDESIPPDSRSRYRTIGLPLDESEDLLNQLWAHATKPEFEWYQVWKVGDLVMWDNLATLHRATRFADGAHRREMRRVTTLDLPGNAAA